MARNHKKVICETLQKTAKMNVSVQFDNFINDKFILYTNKKGELAEKTWANTVTIDGMTVEGLQAWDNSSFRDMLMPLLQEYCNKKITLSQLCNRLSGKNISAITVKQDGTEKKEYAKDSYRWSQIDLIDRFYRYIKHYNTVENLKQYFLMINEKTQGCCPYANGWTADRVEQVYLTHCIIPSFIRKELKLDINNNDLKNVIHNYLYDFEKFTDNLHELIGDTKIKDDLYFQMGLI